MKKNRRVEIFIENGEEIKGTFQKGNGKEAITTSLTGKAIRILDTPYKIMLSTTKLIENDEKIIDKLAIYERDIILRDKKALVKKEAVLQEDIQNILGELAEAANPMKLSFVMVKLEKMLYTYEEKECLLYDEDTFGLWCVENCEDFVLKRSFSGIISDRKLHSQCQQIKEEKKRLLMELKKECEGRYYNFLLLNSASGMLFHEILGHYFEINHALKCEAFKGGKKKKISDYPLNACDNRRIGYGVNRFDDEGTPKGYTKLVENGIIQNFLCDSRNLCENQSLTGNCRRSSFFYYPEPRMQRICVENRHDQAEKYLEENLSTLIITQIFKGFFQHKTGEVVLYAYADSIIQKGKTLRRPMYVVIKDYIQNFYKGIVATFGETHLQGIYCISGSGPLYTEAETPDTLINHIFAERIWLL